MRLRLEPRNDLRRVLFAGLLLAGPICLSGQMFVEGAFAAQDATNGSSVGQAASKVMTRVAPRSNTGDTKPANGQSQRAEEAGNRPTLGSLRDPFKAPTPARHAMGSSPEQAPRPPGIAGLLVGDLRLHGLVEESATGRMVAVVTGGGTLAYFLHEDDRLFDGKVTRITPAALYLTRKVSGVNVSNGTVVLRLQPEAGEKP